jgi:ParB family chromosome partitioning protein
MTDDEAVVKMVDANIQREELLPSEKAFAYKMKMDAMRRQGVRSDLTSDQNGPKLSTWSIGEENGISGTQVKRYIRLTELIPELLDYVDQKRIQFTVAVEISYIDQEIQKWLFEYIRDNGTIKLNQVGILRTQLQAGAMTEAKMIQLLNNSQPGKLPSSKLTFSEKKLREYFPEDYTTTEMRNVIEDLLTDWKRRQENEGV